MTASWQRRVLRSVLLSASMLLLGVTLTAGLLTLIILLTHSLTWVNLACALLLLVSGLAQGALYFVRAFVGPPR